MRPIVVVVQPGQAIGRGKHDDLAASGLPIDPLIGKVGEIDRATGDKKRTAAVFVYAGADVERWWRDLRHLPVGRAANEYVSPALRWAHL